MAKYIYGVDFGTTNSALAILDIDTNELVKVFTIPSVLFFPELAGGFSYFTGHEATERYIANKSTGRLLKSIKTVLPVKSFSHTVISQKALKSEDLVAMIIQALKHEADEFLGEKVTTAVIGRPVVFSEDAEKEAIAQKRLEKAVALAGFEKVEYQLEPIAAAFTYERTLTKKEQVLVADFGGGTSDFTLMSLGNNEQNQAKDIVKGGIYIGGDDFDSKIMWHKGTPHFGRGVKEKYHEKWLELPLSYFLNITSWTKMNFFNTLKMKEAIRKSYFLSGNNAKVKNLVTLIEKNLGYHFFKEVEKTKIDLAKEDDAAFIFQSDDIDIEERVSIDEFENTIIAEELQKIEAYLDAFLQKNHVNYDSIDSVFITGGSSRVRALRKVFENKFGREKIKSGDDLNSVAMGLAYSYAKFKG
ncbi:hypothetical chaperone protein [Spirosomataceae bacterium TFI 002]|nr:hypothetical chaperone protein [Spirosomataceae bacterium TFI 002]